MDLKLITDKEIQVNIMFALMKIEGHLAEMALNTTAVDMMEGGEIDELTRPD